MLRPIGGEARDDHDLRLAGALDHLRHRSEPTHAGHLKIEQYHVDSLAREQGQSILCGRNGGGKLEIVLLVDQARKGGADDQRIVDHHHADLTAALQRRPLAGGA